MYNCNLIDIQKNFIYCESIIIPRPPSNDELKYAHRQGVHSTLTAGEIKIVNNEIVSSRGDNLMNVYFTENTSALKIFNNTCVGNENQQHLVNLNRSLNGSTGILNIKNNIFFKQGSAAGNNLAAIKFENINPADINSNRLFKNLYYNNNGPGVTLYFLNYGSFLWNYYDVNAGIQANPLFVNYFSNNFKLDYRSPAKNLGLGLLNEGINIDRYGNERPYWGTDYDAGAFEIEDTQLKLGASGIGSQQAVEHSVTAFGYFWERNPDASFTMSENYQLQSATSSSTGNFDKNNLFGFPGVEYDWLDRSHNSSGKVIAAGFYSITNTLDPTKFMYLDLRDAVSDYSLNVYLRYKYDPVPALRKFQYYDPAPVVQDFVDLIDYQYPIVTIWQINNYDLQNSPFWQHGVVVVKSPANHPLVCWLPFGSGNIYSVERSNNCVNPNDWVVVGTTTNEYLEDTGLEFCTAVPPATCLECTYNYRVKQSTSTTNPTTVSLVGSGEYGKYAANSSNMTLNFSLEQNYPNPFNPVTIIRYNLSEESITSLVIYDILGREITTLLNEKRAAGSYSVEFDGSKLASGIYICKLSSGKYSAVKKLQLIK